MRGVALYDPSPVDIKDLGCQFYLTSDDVGKPTAAACKDRLQELNKAVQVGVLETISQDALANYQVCPVVPSKRLHLILLLLNVSQI